MANPLAKSILNNISRKELKTSASCCGSNNKGRLSGKEEELLTRLMKREDTISYKAEAVALQAISKKSMTLEALAEKLKRS